MAFVESDDKPRRSGFDVDAIQSALVGLDALVADLERTWGVGRLRLLAPDDLRAKFDRQTRKLDQAIWSQEPAEYTVGQIQAMRRGWLALVAAVEQAGHKPQPPDFFEFALSDGTACIIVKDEADISTVRVDGRKVAVYTLNEIRRLLEARPGVSAVKVAFPGAEVASVRRSPIMDWAFGDELPEGLRA